VHELSNHTGKTAVKTFLKTGEPAAEVVLEATAFAAFITSPASDGPSSSKVVDKEVPETTAATALVDSHKAAPLPSSYLNDWGVPDDSFNLRVHLARGQATTTGIGSAAGSKQQNQVTTDTEQLILTNSTA